MNSPPPLLGLHHVSALTAQASANLQFYRNVLGLRLVLKTVNQDDPSSYHLFYGDETGSPGTDLTFFDVPHAREERPGHSLITGLSLRVRGSESLEQWPRRLDRHDVRRTALHNRAGRRALTLYDEEGLCLHLVDDTADTDRVPDTTPWTDGPVPSEVAIQGLGPVEITVADLAPTRRVLTEVLGFTEAQSYDIERLEQDTSSEQPIPSPNDASEAVVFETEPGGVAAELHVIERPNDPRGWLGTGGVHHLALRTPDGDTIRAWRERVVQAGLDPSPVIDRHYFESMYVREPGGILIEIATDTGAPFPTEEAAAGTVSLPPSLEPNRNSIEEQLPPLGPPSSTGHPP
jgi:glyoxalase family protein